MFKTTTLSFSEAVYLASGATSFPLRGRLTRNYGRKPPHGSSAPTTSNAASTGSFASMTRGQS
jgi:hypothetical protein